MKKLTPEIARKFSIPYFYKIKDKSQRDFIIVHSQAVVEIVKLLAKNTKANMNVLEIAGWVHDIGKSVEQEPHAEESLKILEKKFFVNDILKDCILNHGYSKKPLTFEGKIIRAADKISILDRKILPIFLKNHNPDFNLESLDMLEKITEQAMEFLKEYNENNKF